MRKILVLLRASLVLLLLSAVIAGERGTIVQAGPLSPVLTLGFNQTTLRPRDTVRVGLSAQNPGPPFMADFYFGVLLPDGVTIVFFTSLSPLNVVVSRLDASPQTFTPIVTNILIPQGFALPPTDIFEFTFSGQEPVGTYVFFALLTPPTAFTDGRVDASDILAIDVKTVSTNSAPTAAAGPDQNVITGAVVTLDGRGSSDADGDLLTLAWAFVSVPAGSTAMLANPTAVNPTFTADVAGTYVVRLVVNDGQVSSAEARVTITVMPPAENRSPAFPQPTRTLVTTQNQFDNVGRLIGAVTSLEILTPAVDPDGDPLTYAWTATNGSIISNGGPTATWTRVINFGRPEGGIVRATVTDGRGGTATFTFTFN